jgi:5-methylcytosine-specific restriction endonuclease McrA
MAEKHELSMISQASPSSSEDEGISHGERFTESVVDINQSGVGRVETDDGEKINIGPVDCEPNQVVELEYIGDGFARCLDESIQAQNYETRFNILSKNYDDVPVNVGDEYGGEVIESYSDTSNVQVENVHVNIEDDDLDVGDRVTVEITGFASQSANGNLVRYRSQSSENKGVKSLPTNSKDEKLQESPPERAEPENIEELRHQAKEASQDANQVIESHSTVRQYSRSEAVKQYARARAAGVCEGCGSDAPFVAEDGEPYLHVHHIQELSEGGEDAPENVACLCPNCHYRVHHGKDGGEFNEKIRDKILDKEK